MKASSFPDAKKNGIHFTPPLLAAFLAGQAIPFLPRRRTIRVMDPACGDGELLVAAVVALRDAGFANVSVTGFETDPAAVDRAGGRLREICANVQVEACDFLELTAERAESPLLREASPKNQTFDLVIANPPYVRTQVLGAARSQQISRRFDLAGRADLYQAFMKAITFHLAPDGVMALLTSNRFMLTRSGTATRRLIREQFDILRVIDLGDTKLFEAAVLPAIMIARPSSAEAPNKGGQFLRIYARECGETDRVVSHTSLFDALSSPVAGAIQTLTGTYELEVGSLATHEDDRKPWSLESPNGRDWLDAVRRATAKTFGEVGSIRVGIKTTADSVFIRNDWHSLPEAVRPEAELLRPLVTRDSIQGLSIGGGSTGTTRVLYTHRETATGKREAIDLETYPRARAYLESHRPRLEGRTYVLEAKRAWYEIWVPQSPGAWRLPKLVFPDISETPLFAVDRSGAIVNGDCYWIHCAPGIHEDWLWLMLAVSRSSLIPVYYDAVFHNKLYSGKRRFITQYVKEFPLPAVANEASRAAIQMVKSLAGSEDGTSNGVLDKEGQARLDALVCRAFGLPEEILRQGNLSLPVYNPTFETSKEIEEVLAGRNNNAV